MKLSVVIPTYNRAVFLGETIQSVLDQTRPPDEILILDDGSTDDTRAIVAALGDRVAYYYQANAGLSAARNAGQARTTGDALCFLDSDDRLLPGALAALEAALLAAPEAALAYCRAQIIDECGAVVEGRWRRDDYAGDVWTPLLADGNFVRSAGCVLIRRSHLLQTDPWDTELPGCEDWDMWLRLAERAPFVRVDEPLFQYRVHGVSLTANPLRTRRADLAVCRKHLARHENDPARRRVVAAAHDEFQRCVSEGAPGSEQFGLQRRHRLLRGLLEGTGGAELYRRLPLRFRRWLRGAFGVNRRA